MLATPKAEAWLAPLQRFYEKTGQSLPPVRFLAAEELPEPERGLLVHSSDMTSRLRAYHGSEISLDVLDVEWQEQAMIREVILRRERDLAPVEFGAIKIHLDRLPKEVAEQVREGKRPLGGILEAARLPFTSGPRAFFEIEADALMAYFLGGKARALLRGRCNVLANQNREDFAEIVEILPALGSESACVKAEEAGSDSAPWP